MAVWVDKLWDKIGIKIVNFLKVFLIENHVVDIMKHFSRRLIGVVRGYCRHLPLHVIESEGDDLKTISQLELLETIKVWDSINNEDVWPLAQARIVGAMRDHIRYLTRTDPTRVYDWILDSASDYMSAKKETHYVDTIDNDDQLDQALAVLSDKERRVVLSHAKQDLTFKVIGEQLKLSESQASRIYKQAIVKMRKVMNMD
tara:strand:+ start:10923 stop:11525 length:603 start_codon:yes stop_codon:yes gene_type:complete